MAENERVRERASGHALNTLLSPLSQRIHPLPDDDEGARGGGGQPAVCPWATDSDGESEAAGRWPHSGVNQGTNWPVQIQVSVLK